MSPVTEGCTSIIVKDHRIDGTVNDQEGNQEQTRQRHYNFLTDRACKQVIKPIHRIAKEVYATQNTPRSFTKQ